ncbi:YbaK/EbsC family protein [Nonomuraea sp. CA-141351]|uniref:YbaK/EbsC family protein n=1 Tax=Nonomuraea sp. CA-141351 TaxID=3239996 RepID=UPI003D8CFEEA
MSGTVLPFSHDSRLELVADPSLLDQPELYFNAARLDRSVAPATDDYVRLGRAQAGTDHSHVAKIRP